LQAQLKALHFKVLTDSLKSLCAAKLPGVLQQQAAVMDSVYGPYTGPGWQPAAVERTAPRYLWTDAFGVANYLTLYHGTKENR
jgi:hypothetical protein